MREYRIGPYRLDRRLGRGASATVVEAIDERTGARVALKVPHPDRVADASARAELEREARVGALVASPHVVRLLDFVSDGPATALVLELVDGVELAPLLPRGVLAEPPLAALVTLDLALGLADIHATADPEGRTLGLVHGDASPSNALLDRRGVARWTDLGLARRRAMTAATASGLVRGTPGYVAPEVVRGHPVTPAAEVFALGVLLWELLSARPAFARPDPIAALRATVEEPLSPTEGPLGEVVARATAKRPERRFESAGALAATLAPFTDETVRWHVAEVVSAAAPR